MLEELDGLPPNGGEERADRQAARGLFRWEVRGRALCCSTDEACALACSPVLAPLNSWINNQRGEGAIGGCRAALACQQDDVFVARAPGRLDVMGGIADYSGSLVLQASCRPAGAQGLAGGVLALACFAAWVARLRGQQLARQSQRAARPHVCEKLPCCAPAADAAGGGLPRGPAAAPGGGWGGAGAGAGGACREF